MKTSHRQDMNQRQQQFFSLYKNVFPAFARFVCQMGGNLDEAKDIFQDALLAWYEKSASTTLTIDKSETAYVLGIAKYLWIKRYNSALSQTVLSAAAHFDLPYLEEASPSEQRILKVLERTGRKCLQLLKSFYYDKLSAAKLAELYHFSGERSATAQKYKCLEKVRNEVKRQSLSYADFID